MKNRSLFGWLLAAAVVIILTIVCIKNFPSKPVVTAQEPPSIESEVELHFGPEVKLMQTLPIENNETKAALKDTKENFIFQAIFSDKNYLVFSNYIERYVGKQLEGIIHSHLQLNNIYGYSFMSPNRIGGDDDKQKLQDFIAVVQPEYFSGNLYVFDDDNIDIEAITKSLNIAHEKVDKTPLQVTVYVLNHERKLVYEMQFSTIGEVEPFQTDIKEKYIINSMKGSTTYENIR